MGKRTIIMTAFLILSFPLILIAQTESEESDSLYYWEQQGFEDGKEAMALKTMAAGAGGCGLGAIGLLSGSELSGGCVPSLVGGSLGCLGGWGLGSLTQKKPAPPLSESPAYQEAYMQGYRKGKLRADINALVVGAGAAVVPVGVVIAYFFWAISQ